MSINIGGPDMLQRGVGRHRLSFPAGLDTRGTIPKGVVVALTGNVWLGQYRSDLLGSWTTEKPVVTYDQPFTAQLVMDLSDEQLAVLEQRRAGGDLALHLDIDAVIGYDLTVAGDASADNRWPAAHEQMVLTVMREVWVRLLQQSSAGTSLAIVVPISLTDGTHSEIGQHLREAIRKINNGECQDAVTEARKALDMLDEALLGAPSERTLLGTKAQNRSYGERFALLKSALHSFANPSAHGDQLAKTFTWDRVTALAVVSAIAALVACPLPTFAVNTERSAAPQ